MGGDAQTWLAVAQIAAPIVGGMLNQKQQGGSSGGVSLTPPGAGSIGRGGGGSILSQVGTPQNSAIEMLRRSMPFLNTPQFGQGTPSGVPEYIRRGL